MSSHLQLFWLSDKTTPLVNWAGTGNRLVLFSSGRTDEMSGQWRGHTHWHTHAQRGRKEKTWKKTNCITLQTWNILPWFWFCFVFVILIFGGASLHCVESVSFINIMKPCLALLFSHHKNGRVKGYKNRDLSPRIPLSCLKRLLPVGWGGRNGSPSSHPHCVPFLRMPTKSSQILSTPTTLFFLWHS